MFLFFIPRVLFFMKAKRLFWGTFCLCWFLGSHLCMLYVVFIRMSVTYCRNLEVKCDSLLHIYWGTYKTIRNYTKVKWSRYRPGVAQRVGRGIALLFHDRSTRRGWVVNSTPRPHFTPGKDPVPILQEGGWAPGPVWTGGKSRSHRDSIPDRPDRSQSLYRLSYPVHA